MENWINFGIIAIYMAVVIGVGFLFNSKKETTENYLLGGRGMNYIAIGLSMMMTLLSSISLVQVPGEIFNNGWTLYSLAVLNIITVPLWYKLFIPFYFKLRTFTPYSYLELRYDSTVRTTVAVCAFYARTMYLGMVLYTTSKIFEGAYGWPSWVTILLVGVVGAVYTVLGGLKAVVWTDVIQFFVMTFGLVMILVILNNNLDGGIFGGISYAWAHGRGAPQYAAEEFYHLKPYIRLCFWLLLYDAIFGGISSVSSDQLNVQRILATKDWKTGLKSQWISTILSLASLVVLYIIGWSIYTYYAKNPDPQVTAGDLAFFRFIATKMPVPIPGIFMAAMLAAIMSTLDSGMNSMATVWLKEFHSRFINKNMTAEKEIKVAKIATLVIGVFAIGLALALDFSGKWLRQSVAEVGTLFNLLGAITLPAFLFAALSKRANALLIWSYTFFAFGESVLQAFWYASSRSSYQAWVENPALGFGWAGRLPFTYAIIAFIIGALLILPFIIKATRKFMVSKIAYFAGLIAMGAMFRLLIWAIYSNACITDVPKECSFAFHLPFSFLITFVILRFCPVQPEKKWKGLTFTTAGEEIIADK